MRYRFALLEAQALFDEVGMQRRFGRIKFGLLFVLFVLTGSSCPLSAQTPTGQEATANSQKQVSAEVLKKIDQLVQQNEQLEKQNHELIDQSNSLRQFLGKSAGPPRDALKTGAKSPESSTTVTAAKPPGEAPSPGAEQLEADGNGGEPPAGPVPSTDSTSGQEQPSRWGTYTPNLGFKVAN